jgi:hypothetical protein
MDDSIGHNALPLWILSGRNRKKNWSLSVVVASQSLPEPPRRLNLSVDKLTEDSIRFKSPPDEKNIKKKWHPPRLETCRGDSSPIVIFRMINNNRPRGKAVLDHRGPDRAKPADDRLHGV